ncbi:MAG: circularly permuted type 2 ATP-grasp protein [Clostridiales bacterium]|jgi:glutathionylspermidine synthase|nr:circularly permuted type 2 ATP-grasp protein [Clostridiales bacterium]
MTDAFGMRTVADEFRALMTADPPGAAADFAAARAYIAASGVSEHGQLSFLAVPKLITPPMLAHLQAAAATAFCILEKVIDRYLTDAAYRKLFPFPKALESLILADAGYARRLPVARMDIFLNEETGDFKFCEVNTDGASAMNEDRELVNAWRPSALWQRTGERYELQPFELFDSWARAFLAIYKGFPGAAERPRVAIADFLELGTKAEFYVFRDAFVRAGADCIVTDVRTLRYEGGVLTDESGNRIHAIYRRAVTTDCIKRLDKITALLAAVRDKAVCLIGAFRTQVVHNKKIFIILRAPQTKAFLTAEENDFIERHIPKTYVLGADEKILRDVMHNKDKWIVKPADEYGSSGVATGGDYSHEGWEELVKEAIPHDYIAQEFVTGYKTHNTFFDKTGKAVAGEYNNMLGMFMYDGRLSGLYSRQMLTRVTTKHEAGRVVCAVRCVRQGKNN